MHPHAEPMNRLRLLASIGLTLLLPAACREPTSPSLDVVLVASDTAFVATALGYGSFEIRIPITTINRGARSVELETCGPGPGAPVYLVGGGNAGESAYNPAWACTGGGGVVLRAGETRVDTLRLFGPTARRGSEYLGSLEGWMHVGYVSGRTIFTSHSFLISLPPT